MRGHSGETFHSRAGPRGGTRPERGRSCYPERYPSLSPVFPGPPASAASEPARTGRQWRVGAGGSAGRVFCVGPVFAPRPGRPGPGQRSLCKAGRGAAEPAGKRQSRCHCQEGPAAALAPELPGTPPAGEGAESPRGRRGRPGQPPGPPGSICRGRERRPGSAPPAPSPLPLLAAPSARPGPGSALPAPAPPVWPVLLSIVFPLFPRRQQLPFFPLLYSIS